ncbi:MAG: hypothetical protein WDO13_06120 [Verrucomicrobiota bacterium]
MPDLLELPGVVGEPFLGGLLGMLQLPRDATCWRISASESVCSRVALPSGPSDASRSSTSWLRLVSASVFEETMVSCAIWYCWSASAFSSSFCSMAEKRDWSVKW